PLPLHDALPICPAAPVTDRLLPAGIRLLISETRYFQRPAAASRWPPIPVITRRSGSDPAVAAVGNGGITAAIYPSYSHVGLDGRENPPVNAAETPAGWPGSG